MKKLATILLAASPLLHAAAQEKPRQEVSLLAGLIYDTTYELEASFHYLLHPCIGIGGGLGYYKQWEGYAPSGELNSGKWTSWNVADDDRKIGKLYLSPSVLLRTPRLLSIGKCGVHVSFQPELMAQLPYTLIDVEYHDSRTNASKTSLRSTNDGKWLFWNTRTMLTVSHKNRFYSIGYRFSNLDVYSSYRPLRIEHATLGDSYPSKKYTYGLFVQIGGRF